MRIIVMHSQEQAEHRYVAAYAYKHSEKVEQVQIDMYLFKILENSIPIHRLYCCNYDEAIADQD